MKNAVCPFVKQKVRSCDDKSEYAQLIKELLMKIKEMMATFIEEKTEY